MAVHYIPSLLDTTKVSPMSKELTEMFLKCTMMEAHLIREGKLDYFTSDIAKEMGFMGKMLWVRMKAYAGDNPMPQVTVGATIVAAMQCKNPGTAVMWAFTLNRMFQVDKKPVDMKVLANAFPVGFPTDEGLEEIWVAQKGKEWGEQCDNLLDNPDLLADVVSDKDKQEWCKWLTK